MKKVSGYMLSEEDLRQLNTGTLSLTVEVGCENCSKVALGKVLLMLDSKEVPYESNEQPLTSLAFLNEFANRKIFNGIPSQGKTALLEEHFKGFPIANKVPCDVPGCMSLCKGTKGLAAHRFQEHGLRKGETITKSKAKPFPCKVPGCNGGSISARGLETHKWRNHRQGTKSVKKSRNKRWK